MANSVRSTPMKQLLTILAALVVAMAFGQRHSAAQSPRPPKNAEDVLGHLVVEASRRDARPPPRTKIGVEPSTASDEGDVMLHAVVGRDLELSGEFAVLTDSQIPDGLYLADDPVDVVAWKKAGAEAVVRLRGTKKGDTEHTLTAEAYLTDHGSDAVFTKTLVVSNDELRVASHRLADAVIGALTGQEGAFASQLAFVMTTGKTRRVYRIDADGHDPRAVSREGELTLTPAFGPNQALYYAASVRNGRFRIYRAGVEEPLSFEPVGSVYGMAFSPDKRRVALSIGVGAMIHVFTGPSDFSKLTRLSPIDRAMHPAFSPSGKVAFSGAAGEWVQRIYVDGKPVTNPGISASGPTFCRHPEGTRLVYHVGVGKNTDLVASDENGTNMARLTKGQGRNSFPACSPDGRLVAFFSTRKTGAGPGLYVMRTDGWYAQRISTLTGDSLRWARLPQH